MSLPDVLEIDLPTMILIVILWLIDYMKNRKTEPRTGTGDAQRGRTDYRAT